MVVPAVAFVALTATCYVLHALTVKFSAAKIDPYSGLFFYVLGALVVGIAALSYGRVQGPVSFSPIGAGLLMLAGMVFTVGSLGYLMAFNRGLDFSFATPLVNISVVMGGLIFGMLVFGEHISLMRLSGVILGGISIFLLTRG